MAAAAAGLRSASRTRISSSLWTPTRARFFRRGIKCVSHNSHSFVQLFFDFFIYFYEFWVKKERTEIFNVDKYLLKSVFHHKDSLSVCPYFSFKTLFSHRLVSDPRAESLWHDVRWPAVSAPGWYRCGETTSESFRSFTAFTVCFRPALIHIFPWCGLNELISKEIFCTVWEKRLLSHKGKRTRVR